MKKTDYNKDHATHYDASRDFIPETRKAWLTAVRKYLPARKKLRIIDIGSGTGRFAELFANEFDASITGVEPSNDMRNIAEAKKSSGRIRYLKGGAESLPITDERFDLAWLSMVIHHIEDRPACASEAARVLDKNGIVLVRNNFKGRLDSIECYKYFPGTLEMDNDRLPSVEKIRNIFEVAGFSFIAHESIHQTYAADFQAYYEKISNRGISTFRLISDEEFQKGLARMEAVLKSGEHAAGPITEFVDMLVFKKGAGIK